MTYKIPENAVITAINGDYTENTSKYTELSGLCISTDKGDIKLLIDPDVCCCENYGALFLETPDDTSRFIGAKILEVSDVTTVSANHDDYYVEAGGETQLKITTNKGVLQYAVYNSHNGYYSHATFTQVFSYEEKGWL